MKISMALLTIILTVACTGQAQTINWRALHEGHENVVRFNAGYDYGATTQIGYCRAVDLFRPAVLGVEYSFPMGKELFDDFKVRLGGQIEVLTLGGFSTTVKVYSVFRRHETSLVRIASFGSDLGVAMGYYQPVWFIGGEFGFDKAITSHLKHSGIMRASFPGIRDGWLVPTGGNFHYGLEGGVTVGALVDLSVRIGATRAQGQDVDAVIPLYLQVGVGVQF